MYCTQLEGGVGENTLKCLKHETRDRRPAGEITKPIISAGTLVNGTDRGKKCIRYQAQENMKSVPSAGKHVISFKRG